MEICERVKYLRKKCGLSVDDIAKSIGLSRATVHRYENQNMKNIPATVIEPLAKALNCSLEYLMGWDDNGNSFMEPLEEQIIHKYRHADDLSKAMVLRILYINEQFDILKKIICFNIYL